MSDAEDDDVGQPYLQRGQQELVVVVVCAPDEGTNQQDQREEDWRGR